ncbi:hypothetical protein CRYUN_Cryun15aG0068200 [Craigia yunnanensis]
MEEGDKSIGVGGETSSRVSAGSPSWLCASRQRFTIELRPGETTIVSWKRLVKDAQNTSPPLTVRKTEDSLDECFQDDKSTVKQNGLLVNSEKLECLNEPVLSVAQQSRKRSKNMVKAQGEKVDHVPCKHAKLERGRLNFAATIAPLEEKSSALLQNLAANSEHDQNLHNLLSSPVRSSIRKPVNTGTKSEQFSDTGISNNDASISPLNSKDADKHRSVNIHSRDIRNNTNSVATHQKYLEKNSCKQLESPVRKLMTDNDEVGVSTKVEQREKRATCGELPDLNLPVYSVQPEKSSSVHSKDVSNLRPKGTMLERAIRELEKVVAESRLATIEVQDVDASSAAIKRRLPREAKQKLAKVAKLAQSSQGKISEELINRLMNIFGHSVQLRTLKASKRRDVATDDLQEVLVSEEQVGLKEQYTMDNTMEDKICDLYDLYVQGMDEVKGPQIRKLYVELAELWPNGIMDNHGIKSAIHRAKERRRALCEYDKVGETMDQHLAAPLEISHVSPKGSTMDISKEEKIEKMMIPMLKEKMKHQQQELKNRVKKLSLKLEKESRKSHKRAIRHPDAASYELAAPSSCGHPV